MQEIYKGKNDAAANALGGGSDPYNGWAFTKESDSHIKEVLGVDICPISPSYHHGQLGTNDLVRRAAFRETLKTDPLFDPDLEILFGAGGDTFAGATVATCGFTFNYDLPNATVDIAAVPVRDYLLAKALPARTGALGSRLNGEWDEDVNLDMSTSLRNPYAPVLPNDDDDWVHSAIRDFPYVHMCNFFRKLTGKPLITTP